MKHLKIFLLLLTLSGCASWGENLGGGLATSLQSHADSIAYKLGYGLISGIRDSLTGRESQEKLAALIDTILHHAGLQSSKEVSNLLDTLAGETTNGRIRALLQNAQHGLDSLRDDVLGKKTGSLLAKIIQNDILGTNTQLKLQHLMSSGVLGAETQTRIGDIMATVRDSLFGGSLDSVVKHSLARVQATGDEQQSFLKKNITAILWTVGVILGALLILAAFLFVRKRKTETMLKTVTQQINKIPVRESYDELTKRISENSKRDGVEKDLRVFLAKNIPAKTE